MLHLVVTRPENLELASAELHDWFLALGDVRLDERRHELVVPFSRGHLEQARLVHEGLLSQTHELPYYRWYLRVGRAVSYQVHDESGLGETDINELHYDAGAQVLTIEGNLPVTITVRVEGLHVSVQETGEHLGVGRRKIGRLLGTQSDSPPLYRAEVPSTRDAWSYARRGQLALSE